MNRLIIKDWVCLVSEATLEAKREALRARARQHDGGLPGPLREKLWRQIQVVATPEHVTLELGNVDYEASQGGYWTGSDCCRSHVFAWEDLGDVENIDRVLAREQVVVYRRIVELLQRVEARAGTLREALSSI